MVALAQFQQILWAVNVAVGVALAVLLVVRKNYRVYPSFTFYIFLNLIQAVLLFITYHRWGFNSVIAWRIFWLTLGVVICARALAVAEICRHLLSRYRGVWALAWRILLLCAAVVLSYSILAARRDWRLALPTADRGLELSIATVIVVLLLFARYYDVKGDRVVRSLAIGFCLYSCFAVLNNTVLERLLYDYSALWNLLDMLAFLASLSVWTSALRHSQSEAQPKEILLPSGIYQAVAPEINFRLRLLNKQLSQFWKVEAPEL
ncbi:MAG TPA: hypothetical protein VHF01_09415 [Candidatus Acidoferrum sp.]|nr:hypothetical protein [Candidatus Acidoferrum sp.]